MKKLLSSSLRIFIAICIGLLLVEGLVRLFIAPPLYWENMDLDPELGFHMKSGMELKNSDEFGVFDYRLNSNGYRGPELPAETRKRPDGRTRIVFVGDSFLNAWDVREEYLMTNQTRDRIAARGRPAEVYSLCSDSYSTAQELLLLRRHGAKLAPDAVVLALFTGNDFMNNTPLYAGYVPGDYLRPYLLADEDGVLCTHHLHPARTFLRSLSRTFAIIEHRLIARKWLEIFPSRPDALPWGHRVKKGLAPGPELDFLLKEGQPPTCQEAWTSTDNLLKTFRDEVRALGARLLVLVIPSRYQVQLDAWWLHVDWHVQKCAGKSMDDILDWNMPERRLAAFFAREGIDARFLLGPLRAAVDIDKSSIYVPNGHLSWRGHVVAADSIAAWFLGDNADALDEKGVSSGRPTLCIPEIHQAPGRLDFRTSQHRWALLDGWHSWNSPRSGPGWHTGKEMALMMPVRGGELLVQGKGMPESAFPVKVTVTLGASPSHEYVLENPGPFEIRYPSYFPGVARGYTPLEIVSSSELVIWEIAYGGSSGLERVLFEMNQELRRQGKSAGEVLVIPDTPQLSWRDLDCMARRLNFPLSVHGIESMEDGRKLDINRFNQVDFLVAITFPPVEVSPPLPAWVQVNRWLLGEIPPGPPPQLVELVHTPSHVGVDVLLYTRQGTIADPDLYTVVKAVHSGGPRYVDVPSVGRPKKHLSKTTRELPDRRLWTAPHRGDDASRLQAELSGGDSGLTLTVHGSPGSRYYLLRSRNRRRCDFPFGIVELNMPEAVRKGDLDRFGKVVIHLGEDLLPASSEGGHVYFQVLLEKGPHREVTNWVAVSPSASMRGKRQ